MKDKRQKIKDNNFTAFDEMKAAHLKMMPHKHEVNHVYVTTETVRGVLEGVAANITGETKRAILSFSEQMRCDYLDWLKKEQANEAGK